MLLVKIRHNKSIDTTMKTYMLSVVIFLQTLYCTFSILKADDICSTNTQCVNLPTGDETSVVCAFNYASCNDLIACSPDFSCARPNTVCVKHRCHIHPVCYPMTMTSHTICPPISRESIILYKNHKI